MTIQEMLLAPRGSSVNELILNLRNDVSAGTAGVYIAKAILGEHLPYLFETRDTTTVLIHNFHFLAETRRQLAGTATEYNFSPKEQLHYDNYIMYSDGEVLTGEDLVAVTALDKWLVDEVQDKEQLVPTRVYEKGVHPWRKFEPKEVE